MTQPVDKWPVAFAGKGRPLVIAHGDEAGCGLYPGNTLLYLKQMVSLGVDALEMDLNLTADGHLVLMHDTSLERTSDGTGLVREHTLAELRRLNMAYHWRRQENGETFHTDTDTDTDTEISGDYPYRNNPLSVATIDEVFAALPQTPMIIELKNDDDTAAIALSRAIANAGCSDRVIVSSFHSEVIRTFRRLSPGVATGATMWEALIFYAAHLLGAERRLKPAYQTMQLPMRFHGIPVFTKRFIRATRRLGLHISVWTVDKPGDMQRYIDRGLDGIVTNRPDTLFTLLRSRTRQQC